MGVQGIQILPEMVLGKEARLKDGATVGPVVDVGVHGVRQVKFLLVEERPRRFVRLNVEDIDTIERDTVTLRPK